MLSACLVVRMFTQINLQHAFRMSASQMHACFWVAHATGQWMFRANVGSSWGSCDGHRPACCQCGYVTCLLKIIQDEMTKWDLRKFNVKWYAIIQSCRLTLFGHIMRMDDNADAKKILLASPPADWRRQLGRPRITWLSTVQLALRQHHLTLPEAADLAPLWRMMSTYGATQSWVACHKRWRRRYAQYVHLWCDLGWLVREW